MKWYHTSFRNLHPVTIWVDILLQASFSSLILLISGQPQQQNSKCCVLPSFYTTDLQVPTCASDCKSYEDASSLWDVSPDRKPAGSSNTSSETFVTSNVTLPNSLNPFSQYHFKTTLCWSKADIIDQATHTAGSGEVPMADPGDVTKDLSQEAGPPVIKA